MEQGKRNTGVAGIDASKAKLDVAEHKSDDLVQVSNDEAGFEVLEAWLKDRGITRVGIEATGGYERAVVIWLRARGFEVVVHQPGEIRAFARWKKIRAKTDRIDARVIALATAFVETVKAANDPVLYDLAERMTAYEQASDQVAQFKTYLEHVTLADLKAQYEARIAELTKWKTTLAADLIRRIRAHKALAARLQLLQSLPGIGSIVAACLVVRMPELGALPHGRAASLIGVAPFDFESGKFKGQSHIWGGRGRPRRLLYMSALVAKRFDPWLKPFAERLLKDGKAPKVVIVAVMRKLIEAANLVLARGTPWQKHAPA